MSILSEMTISFKGAVLKKIKCEFKVGYGKNDPHGNARLFLVILIVLIYGKKKHYTYSAYIFLPL